MEQEPDGRTVDAPETEKTEGSQESTRRNERSTIAFPYLDLDTAIEVAQCVYSRAGLSPCEIDELAAEMNQTVSGSFRLKTSAAKMYGYVDKDGRSRFTLTELGEKLVDNATEKAARVEGFLNIPLYAAIFEKYRGKLLPSAKALEREMTSLGVAHKQADKARQTFERSAKQAGFFEQGDDRLVKPRIVVNPVVSQAEEPEPAGATEDINGKTMEKSALTQTSATAIGNNSKPLEYLLIDLLKDEGIQEEEKSAIWTLVQYLTRKGGPA